MTQLNCKFTTYITDDSSDENRLVVNPVLTCRVGRKVTRCASRDCQVR